MKKAVNLISAFAWVGIIIGIIITVAAENGSALSEAGMGIVVVAGIVAVICQIIILILRKRDPGE